MSFKGSRKNIPLPEIDPKDNQLLEQYFTNQLLENEEQFIRFQLPRLKRLQNFESLKRQEELKRKISQFREQTCDALQQNWFIDDLYDDANELNIDLKNMPHDNFINFCEDS